MKVVRTKAFDRGFKRIGAATEDFDALVDILRKDPTAGDVIEGLRGVRKVRFPLPSRRIGKSGGGRAIYVLIEVNDALILLAAYAKNQKANLSSDDRKAIVRLLDELERRDD